MADRTVAILDTRPDPPRVRFERVPEGQSVALGPGQRVVSFGGDLSGLIEQNKPDPHDPPFGRPGETVVRRTPGGFLISGPPESQFTNYAAIAEAAVALLRAEGHALDGCVNEVVADLDAALHPERAR